MKKLLLAPALAAALLLSAAAPAPAISTSGESSGATTQYNVYQCWTYDNHNRWWFGQHANLNVARNNAMTACRANNDQYSRCWHWDRPCQIVTVY